MLEGLIIGVGIVLEDDAAVHGSISLMVFYLLLALGVSFLCSLVESGLLSLPRSRVVQLAKKGYHSGKLLESMKDNVERPLSAILTLNTVAHTIGAAGVGAQSLALFGDAWVAATSVVLTILILVFSEIIPKTLGVVYAVPFASAIAYTVQAMIFVTYPLVVVFQSLSRVIGGGDEHGRLTREEFAIIAELGQSEGALREREYRIIKNLLRLKRISVEEIMTPRSVVFALSKSMPIEEAVDAIGMMRFSRIPVYDKELDDCNSIVLRYEIYEKLKEGATNITLGDLAKPAEAVPETATVERIMVDMIRMQQQLFITIDEYGGMAGIVTLEDAIETLLGEEIVDETDRVPDMRVLAGQLFAGKLRGRRFSRGEK